MSKIEKFDEMNMDIFNELIVGSFRNSELENLHAGIGPTSKVGDFSDVKVVTPYGEIPWNELSRISDEEMGPLKDSIRKNIQYYMNLLIENGLEIRVKPNSVLSKTMKMIVIKKYK